MGRWKKDEAPATPAEQCEAVKDGGERCTFKKKPGHRYCPACVSRVLHAVRARNPLPGFSRSER